MKAVKLGLVLLRYFFSVKGRISMNRYRAFLLWYVFAVLPAFTVLYFALLVLGWSKSGVLREMSLAPAAIATVIYFAGCLWPLVVATTRRMHDLGFDAGDYFFVISPRKSWQLGKEILTKRGQLGDNNHGADPGSFE